MRAKFYYHVSSKWLGYEFVPQKRTPSEIGCKETKTPRLCVCPTIAGCFAARLMESHKTAFVYRTEKRCRSISPRSVWDSVITGERWLIPPIKLIHVANINAYHVDEIQSAVIFYHRITKKTSSLQIRLAQYSRVYEVLGGPLWEGRLIERWKRRFEIGDPRQYLVAKAREYRHKSLLAQTSESVCD